MPDRHQQRTEALKRANEVRERKALLKRSLKSGLLPFAEALDHPDLQDWPIGEVAGFAAIGRQRWAGGQPKVAPGLALGILQAAAVGFNRKVADLTPLERRLMIECASNKEAALRARRRWPSARVHHHR